MIEVVIWIGYFNIESDPIQEEIKVETDLTQQSFLEIPEVINKVGACSWGSIGRQTYQR